MMDELKESIALLLKNTGKLDDIQKHMASTDKRSVKFAKNLLM